MTLPKYALDAVRLVSSAASGLEGEAKYGKQNYFFEFQINVILAAWPKAKRKQTRNRIISLLVTH